MAILNKDQGCVVLSIVYAGAPLSGKTESLRALSELLFGGQMASQKLYSPDHTEGRTLYFDWLDYTGGYFRGYKVNCQLISVPGQKTLKSRRKLLVEMADVIVFVVDSEAERLEMAVNYYQEMQPWLQRDNEPTIGVVVQANKRDSDQAASMADIYTALGDASNLLVIETIATKNSGIREAFVASVRLGLERAAWLLDNKKMEEGAPELADGTALFNLISSKEKAALKEQKALGSESEQPVVPKSIPLDLGISQLHQAIQQDHLKQQVVGALPSSDETQKQPRAAWHDATVEATLRYQPSPVVDLGQGEGAVNVPAADEVATDNVDNGLDEVKVPNLPHKDVVAGSVYPPISGRVILHKLEDAEMSIKLVEANTWEASANGEWLLISRTDDCFISANDARMHLVRCASTHKKWANFLTEHRCMAIVESDLRDEWRVWQIVRHEPTLATLLNMALMDFAPQRIAEKVYIIAEKFMEAYQLFADNQLDLPFSLNTIGLQQNKLLFTSHMPPVGFVRPDFGNLELLRQNFKQPISEALQKNSSLSLGVPYILHPLDTFAKIKPQNKPIVEVLRTLFIGEH